MNLPYAYGPPPLSGTLRSTPEDFRVDEILGYEADGEGPHWLLHVRKRGANTAWVAEQMVKQLKRPLRDISYAGLKDRHAVTTQTFCVHTGEDAPDWSALCIEGVELLSAQRHRRKLKRGALQGNRFEITVRDLVGDLATARTRVQQIREGGVPNYFGEQRFGRDGDNVQRALALFAGRRTNRAQASILISAARSHLFNAMLAERVAQGNWQQGLAGEVWALAGSRSWFGPQDPDAELQQRLAERDIHPSAPLWGRGATPAADACAALEQQVLAPFEEIRRGLEGVGLKQERRATRLFPEDFEASFSDDQPQLTVRFSLPAGCYATTVLRELIGDNAAA